MQQNAPAPQASTVHGPALWRQLQWTAKLVQGVWSGRQSLATTLNHVPGDLRPGVQALVFLVLRHLGLATAIRGRLAARRPPPDADALLCTGIALLLADAGERYPAHTLVDQLVEAAKRSPGARHQAGLINACIRRLARERTQLLSAVGAEPVAQWNYPMWWIKRLESDHPGAWQAILAQGQQPASMVLRVNPLRWTVDDALSALGAAGLGAQSLGANALQLAQTTPVSAIPGFADGRISVQSAAAQLAAPLLLSDRGTERPRILDACAAPGGKTAHMLELCPDACVTALEVDGQRAERIMGTLDRLGLRADSQIADAGRPEDWWDGVPYDRIMLDAPCSASGIVRRHPDIRWLRREADIPQLAAQQDRLLNALWPVLAVGGRMLYVTCSVFHAEGVDRIRAFLAHHGDARLLPSPGHLLPMAPGFAAETGENAPSDDGFFYALLEKRPV